MSDETPRRKVDHLNLCATGEVEFQQKTTLFEDVHLVHCALPEMAESDVDISRTFLGKRLAAPILIGAMTGGARQSARINRNLASAAQELGIGMQLGSQRAMIEDPSLRETYDVRAVAPDIVLLGNIGLAQAQRLTDKQAKALVSGIDADGLCLHLNPAMELFQPEGDRDFRKGLATIRRYASLFGERLVVKETGCGVSREVSEQLIKAGVRCIDVAGAGGTSWVRIEQIRSRPLGGTGPFSEWGIPTAASLRESAALAGSGRGACAFIASGGLRTGLDFAKAIALGATLGSAALPFLRAYLCGPARGRTSAKQGRENVVACAGKLIRELRAACVLTGSRNLAELRRAPVVITGRLREWTEQRVKRVVNRSG